MMIIQGQWRCLWGGSGVWCGSMDYTLLSCSHSVWRLEKYSLIFITQIYMSPLISIFQIKCVQYWPGKLHDSVTLDDKFHVTYSSNMPFAEYEIRKFKLQNVSITEPYQQTLHFPCSPSLCS